MLGSIAAGFLSLLNLEAIFGMVAGLAVGLSFGAMPGLNATIGITLLLPVTFSLNPGPAMLMLIGVYCGATFAGSISAILIKTPGTAAASATVLEGYPMTLQGKAPVALSIAFKKMLAGHAGNDGKPKHCQHKIIRRTKFKRQLCHLRRQK